MLCPLCTCLDFSPSSLQIDPSPPSYWPTPISTKYYVTAHQPSLPALFASAEQGCQLCTLIRSELFHARGHESQEEGHQGPVELRVYVTEEEAKCTSFNLNVNSAKQVQVVARTKMRDWTVMLDFMRFERSCPSTFHAITWYCIMTLTKCSVSYISSTEQSLQFFPKHRLRHKFQASNNLAVPVSQAPSPMHHLRSSLPRTPISRSGRRASNIAV